MCKSRQRSGSKSSAKESNKNAYNKKLSVKSRSNNSSDISVDDQKLSYDSLIHKSEIKNFGYQKFSEILKQFFGNLLIKSKSYL